MLTTKQAAEALGVSIRRVQAMITAGTLKASKVGRDWQISERAVEKAKGRKPGRPKQ